MRNAYRVLAFSIPVLVALQAAFIALNTFGMFAWVDDGNALTKSVLDADSLDWDGAAGAVLHGIVGMMVIPLVALGLLAVSFFAKVPGGVWWAGIVVAVTVLQVLLAFAGFGSPVVGALHGLNAFVLLGVAMSAGQKAGSSDATAPEAARV